jgi:DNA-binding MarR family transcriptional regulator
VDDLKKQAYIFASIFNLANKLQILGDEFDKNVTTKQWLFIMSVSTFEEPPTITEAANYIGYSRQNAKRIAADLQKNGYVELAKDNNDARAQRIKLTPKCIAYFKSRDGREIEFLENLFSGFDTKLTDGFYKGITKLGQNIQEIME